MTPPREEFRRRNGRKGRAKHARRWTLAKRLLTLARRRWMQRVLGPKPSHVGRGSGRSSSE